MKIYEVKSKKTELIAELLVIWENSVRATHNFLADAEIKHIREYVPQAINSVEHLAVAEDEYGRLAGFMGTDKERLEMLFLSPAEREKGLGKRLVRYGVKNYGIREVTVNEQNPQAAGFYEHLGFEVYKRTDCDEEGNPYPLLYMRLL